MIGKQLVTQRDFSGGEINPDAKRRDDIALVKAGARQAANFRILNSGALQNRSGRRLLFPAEARVDEVLVAPGTVYRLCFGNGTLTIRDATGLIVAEQGGFPWTTATAAAIVWTVAPRGALIRDVVICSGGTRPAIARYSSGTWSFLPWTVATAGDGSFKLPFYRMAPPGVTLTPSATTGSITLTASDDVFALAMVGTVIRWVNQQILITAYSNTRSVTGKVLQTLFGSYRYPGSMASGNMFPGDVLVDSVGREAEVVSVELSLGVPVAIHANNFQAVNFQNSTTVNGPSGIFNISGAITIEGSPLASTIWDEAVFSDYRGWPKSCFFDQNRLGFCDMAGVPGGIGWSRTASYDDFSANLSTSSAADPIFEIAPDRVRVLYVVNNKGDEFVFADRGVYYIDISAANPLKPGSVTFRKIGVDGCAQIMPAQTTEGVAFVNAGLTRVVAIIPSYGNTTPYKVIETSPIHSHLFAAPVALAALAATTADGTFQERYIFVLNATGTVAVGKIQKTGETDWFGWLPWSGSGTTLWLSALGANLTFTASYSFHGVTTTFAEVLDDTYYLDEGMALNAAPAAMAAGSDASYYSLLSTSGLTAIGTTLTPLALLFDGNIRKAAAACASGATGGAGAYGPAAGIDWGAGVTKTVTAFTIYGPADQTFFASDAGHVKLQGSQNNAAWTDLTTDIALPAAANSPLLQTTGITATTAYRYHRVIFESTAGVATLSLAQIQFFVTTAGATHQAPGGGTGALWWAASGAVDLIDGVKPMGARQVDATGAIVAENGEDLSSVTLIVGKMWTATLEPFVPQAPPGQDQAQRVKRRRLARFAASVQNSTGFVLAGLYPGPVTPNSPAIGSQTRSQRWTTWRAGEDQGSAPSQREETGFIRPSGRYWDPRAALIKDIPGPITINEIAIEVTI